MENSFDDFYLNIEPELKKYERLRKFLLSSAIIIACLLAGGIFFLVCKGVLTFEHSWHGKILYMTVLLGMFIFWRLKKEFEVRVKEKIIEKFINCFENFGFELWQLGESLIDEKTLKSIKILPKFSESYSDDNFQGHYKGIPVTVSEQKLKNGVGIYKYNVFEGIVIEYFLENSPFPAEIIIRDAGFMPPKGLEKITLEDSEFEKMFSVYSNDQIESRFVLTAGFMEKLKALKIIFGAKHISLYIKDCSIFIAADIGRDSFNVARLYKRADDREQFEKMYKQFDFILNIADLLRLTR